MGYFLVLAAITLRLAITIHKGDAIRSEVLIQGLQLIGYSLLALGMD